MSETIERFRALKCEPYGVNEANAASHQRFIDEINLPFDLLVDEGLEIARKYDVLKPEGGTIARHVVIIGMDGTILLREKGAPDPDYLLEVLRDAKDV